MHLYNNKVINIHAPFTFEGIDYVNLLDPELRERIGIIEVPDPVYPDDRFYFWTSNEDGSLSVIPKTLEQVKQVIREKIASERYEHEVGGTTLPNGVVVATDRESQSKIAGALLYVQRNPTATIDWKGDNGWVTLTKTEVEMIADAVAMHVQYCFSAERSQLNELDGYTDVEELIARYK